MALTQMQIIQSLGEAMTWLEKELNWGVPATEQRHLTGRIGELYTALITNGQMVSNVNQKGYDVVSGNGERISVKTTARADFTGHISFNPNTFDVVDRIIILKINTEEMQVETLLDADKEEFESLAVSSNNSDMRISLSKLANKPKVREHVPVVKSVCYRDYTIAELESGTIEITKESAVITPVKPILREVADELLVSTINSNGNPFNTRKLGSLIIKRLSS